MYPITINGNTIKYPTEFRLSHFNLTTPGRTTDGLMVLDFIAKKKKLFLKYAAISGKELKVILDQIDTNNMFFTVVYYDTYGTAQTKTMYVGEISSTLFMRPQNQDQHVWKDVEFNFIEK